MNEAIAYFLTILIMCFTLVVLAQRVTNLEADVDIIQEQVCE